MTPSSPVTTVAICVSTYKRLNGLRRLLESLARLENVDPTVEVVLVVADNDLSGEARPVVEAARASLPFPVTYVVEEQRGIPQARNACVREAGEVDWYVFVDDDEHVDRNWLSELLRVQRETAAEVVMGPVLPVFAESPPEWAVRGRFFDGPRYPTGTRLHWAKTSSVLVHSALFESGGFDTSFGLRGGEDTHFFMRAWLEGRSIVWADDAIVYETVPAERVSPSWLVRREYRRGNTLSLCLRLLTNTPGKKSKRLMRSIMEVAAGVCLLASSVWRGRAGAVTGLRRLAFGAGLFSGLAGLGYEEYRVVHGE
jgi:glycosyltransferase involved in cell wall biosynthesis